MSPRLGAISLIVSNLSGSIAFYRRLGIDLPDPAEHGHVEVTLPGGIRFMLDSVEEIRSFDPGWTKPNGGQQLGVAFSCGSPTEVDALYESLVSEGVESYREPWDAFWGERSAEVKDPDGNIIAIYAPLESRG